MESEHTFETTFGYRHKMAIGKDVQICIKCGSDTINKEKSNLVCESCGAVSFFATTRDLVK